MGTLTRRLSWALALSIGLNLFLLGFGGARWWRMQRPHEAPHAEPHDGPHGRGHAVWRRLVPPTPELRAQHRTLSDARQAVRDALTAEPYDGAQLERTLGALRATTSKSQELLHERLVQEAAKLTPEQRRELANSRFVRGGPADDGPSP